MSRNQDGFDHDNALETSQLAQILTVVSVYIYILSSPTIVRNSSSHDNPIHFTLIGNNSLRIANYVTYFDNKRVYHGYEWSRKGFRCAYC